MAVSHNPLVALPPTPGVSPFDPRSPVGQGSSIYIAHGNKLACAALGVFLLIALGIGCVTYKDMESRAAERFELLVEGSRQRISDRMGLYERGLTSGLSLFSSLDRDPSRREWAAFVEQMGLEKNYPGMLAIGFAEMLAPAEVESFERSMRSKGIRDFRIRPFGNRDTYSSVVYLEPANQKNRRAPGFDMYSDEARRDAMNRARDTGAFTLSRKVELMQNAQRDAENVVLAYLPVYEGKAVPGSLAARRELLHGFVYGVFSINETFTIPAGETASAVRLRLFDDSASSGSSLMFDSSAGHAVPRLARQSTRSMTVGGRSLRAEFLSTNAFETQAAADLSRRMGLAGALTLLVNLLLFALVRGLSKQHRRVQEEAAESAGAVKKARGMLNQTVQSTGVGFMQFHRSRYLVELDNNARSILRLQRSGQFELKSFMAHVHPADRNIIAALFRPQTAEPLPANLRFRMQVSDASYITISADCVFFDAESDGRVLNAVIRDLSRVFEEDTELRIMKKVLASTQDGFMLTNDRQVITDVNEAMCNITGYHREELIGKTPRILNPKEQGHEHYRDFWQRVRQADYWEGRLWNSGRDGELYAAYERISVVRNTDGEITHFILVITDLTESIEQKYRLENVAITDPLTGLANRSQIHEQLRTEIAQAELTGSAMAVCCLDLDNFRLVNDRLGHTAGDELLVLVSNKLKTLIGTTDTLARVGGAEFALILKDARDTASCERLAVRILSGIRGTYALSDDKKIYVSASMGISLYPRDDSDSDCLLRHAGQAMYEAKDHGRDRFAMFDIEKNRSEQVRRKQVERIGYAIRDHELILHFQPQVNLRTGAVTGAEALVRWQHPENGIVFPDQFLPLVAGSEQAIAIDKWVISEAVQQISRFHGAGLRLPISVNIDGAFLQRADFVDYLSEVLRENPDVEPSMLGIEILESTALTDLDKATRAIRSCQEMGVAVALDDFGTGYCSLTYLKQLPCDTLKIDKSFIMDMTERAESKSLVEGIVILARALGRRIVAEGVESDAHGQMLLGMGCEFAQGYGIQRPIPADDLVTWIQGYAQPETWRNVATNVFWLDRSVERMPS